MRFNIRTLPAKKTTENKKVHSCPVHTKSWKGRRRGGGGGRASRSRSYTCQDRTFIRKVSATVGGIIGTGTCPLQAPKKWARGRQGVGGGGGHNNETSAQQIQISLFRTGIRDKCLFSELGHTKRRRRRRRRFYLDHEATCVRIEHSVVSTIRVACGIVGTGTCPPQALKKWAKGQGGGGGGR